MGGTVIVLMAILGVWMSSVQGEEPPKARNPIMEQKLKHAQKVLEGVAIKDFAMIEKNADELIVISQRAEWKAFQTPHYIQHSDAFRRSCETLVQTAKDKNIEGASLAYVQMTLSCVNCHKYVREIRMAGGDLPDLGHGRTVATAYRP
jgi:hypothetical protein